METNEYMKTRQESFSLKQLVKDFIYGIAVRIQTDQTCLYAAQSSFFIFTSLVPFLIILLALSQVLHMDEAVVVNIIESIAPDFMNYAVSDLVSELYGNPLLYVLLSAVTLIWSAAKAIQGMSYGLNNLLRIEEKRNYFILRFRAMFYTVVLVIVLYMLLLFTVYGGEIRDFVIYYFKLETTPFLLNFVLMFRFLITFIVMMFLFTFIYIFFPNRATTFRDQITTGFCCAFAWSVVTVLLALYVRWFNAFSLYGSMFMLLLWMLWLYTCLIIFFACAQCQPMIKYLFDCLLYKLHGGGEITLEKMPVPDGVIDVCSEVLQRSGRKKKKRK